MKKRGFDSNEKKYDVIHAYYKEKFSGDEFRPETADIFLELRKIGDAIQADNEETLSRPFVVCADIEGKRKYYKYKTCTMAYVKYIWLTRKNQDKSVRAVSFFVWMVAYDELVPVLCHFKVTKRVTRDVKGKIVCLPYDLQEQAMGSGWVVDSEDGMRVVQTVKYFDRMFEEVDEFKRRVDEINNINLIYR